MATGPSRFCGTCGNPRVAEKIACPQCGRPYDDTVTGSLVNATGASQITPPSGVPSYMAGMPGVAAPPNLYPGAISPQSGAFTPVTPGLTPPPPPYTPGASGPTPSLPYTPSVSSPMQPVLPPPGSISAPLPPQKPKRNYLPIIIVQGILNVLLLVAVVVLIVHPLGGTSAAPGTTPNSSPVVQNTRGANPTATSGAVGATATPGANPTSTAAPTSSSTTYSAPQPGPGCDKNGGIWTPQGIGNITCGTQIYNSSTTAPGYLYLQLPNNAPIAANNTLSVMASNYATGSGECIGLAEQDANSGYFAAYCGNGSWFVDTISNGGAINQTLAKNATSTRPNVHISLQLQGDTLTLTIDTETHSVKISPIQPTKIAIAYTAADGNYSITVDNFSYTVLS